MGRLNLSDILQKRRRSVLATVLVACAPVVAAPPASPPTEPVVKLEQVTVAEQRAGAEAAFADKAGGDTPSEVISGAALKSPTAQSTSDLLKNSAGVSVNRGADGASRISIRGLDSRFTRITVDGQRQGGTGNALDSLPPEIVQSIEISKAATPDQDADAIGGAISVTTGAADFKAAHEQGRHQISLNSREPRPGVRNTLGLSRPFALFGDKPDAAALFTLSFDDQFRRRDQYRSLREWTSLLSPSPGPYAGTAIPVLTQGRIESAVEHRQRTGAVLNADAKLGATTLTWRANFTRDWSRRDRRLNEFDPALGTPVTLTPLTGVIAGVEQTRRDQRQTTQRDAANFILGARTTLGAVDLDGTLAAAFTAEDEPHTRDAVFRNVDTFRVGYDLRTRWNVPDFTFVDEGAPGNTTNLNDPARYRFKTIDLTRSETHDRELAARFNAKRPLGGEQDFLKFGGKLQQRHRTADTDRRTYDAGAQPLALTGLVGADSAEGPTDALRFGAVPDADAVAARIDGAPGQFAFNSRDTSVNSATADYTATETIWAAYGLARVKRGPWTLLGGVRAEGTRTATRGNQLSFDNAGRVQAITPAQATRSYWDLLPGLHVRFDPLPTLILRSSVTRTLARPSYGELAPSRLLTFADRRSRAGNPDLKPYAATNFDFSVDTYDARAGLFSVGLFFKKIDHFIADAQYPVNLGELGTFNEFKRINGDSARVYGVETGWQSIAWTLPAGLGSGTVLANYTFLGSETHFPGRPGETFPLADQVKHQAAFTLRAERGKLSVETSVRYRSQMFEDVIAPGFDNYRKGYFDAELSVAYKISKEARIAFGCANVFDAPTHNYSGDTRRVNEFQSAGVDFSLSVQWKR